MNFKKSTFFTLFLLMSVILFNTGCSSKKTVHPHHANPTVALITDASDSKTNPFNLSAINGLKDYANDHNVLHGEKGYEYFIPNYPSEAYSLVDQAAQKNFHLVIGLGDSLKSAIRDSANLYPKNNFVLIGDTLKKQKNVASITFKNQEAAYLAGIVAAKTTKTNVIGFIGGNKNTSQRFENGFVQGIQSQEKKSGKHIRIISKYTNSFSNPSFGNNIAQEIYRQKADIIFSAAGQTGNGVFAAAKKINEAHPVNDKVWVIGVDADQSKLGDYYAKGGQKSNFTLTSVTQNTSLAVKKITDASYNNKFPAGKNITYSLKNDGVDIVQTPNISYSTWISAQKARQKILSGHLKIK